MDLNAKRFNSTPLKYLSGEQMRDIHSAALDILWNCRDVRSIYIITSDE